MKVIVCIPTFNEEVNVSKITKKIDSGLTLLKSKNNRFKSTILLVDSNSTDSTVNRFEATNTNSEKNVFVENLPRGKGKNLYRFFQYFIEHDYDYGLTIDGDVISLTHAWIIDFFEKLINEKYSFVVPSYKRSRFEGSSTNHLCFPITGLFGNSYIRQPIAGDFGFDKKAITKLIDNYNDSIHSQYGIDIFLTLTLNNKNFKVCSIELGQKIHSPSFKNIKYMFPQILNSIGYHLSREGTSITFNNVFELITPNISDQIEFKHEAQSMVLYKDSLARLQSLIDIPVDLIKMEYSELNTFFKNQWLMHYSSFLKKHLKTTAYIQNRNEILILSELFICRAISFWFWSINKTPIQIEREIESQARQLREKLIVE